MILETSRLILRPIVESDAEDIYEYSRNPIVGTNAGWKPHESIEETREIMKTIFLNQATVWGISLKANPKIVGSAGLISDPKRENPHILMLGYALGEPYWGNGYMTEAVLEICRYGFQELNLDAISAYIFPFNDRSRNVLKKAGFQREGSLKKVELAWNDARPLDNECFLLENTSF